MLEELKECMSRYHAAHGEAVDLVKSGIEDAVKELLKDDHEEHEYYFLGYTPSFNDGDPCTFSCYMDEDACDVEIYDEKQYSENFTKLAGLMHSLPDSVVESVWDCDYGMRLTLSKRGISVGDYDCGY